MDPIEIGTAKATEPGLTLGELQTGYMPDGEPVTIPVMILRGRGDGPVFWIQACVHGDEYCGTFIIHEFMRGLAADDISGAVVAMPVLQMPGFHARKRMSPFESFGGGDLNRNFPGDAGGGTTAQAAHAIYGPLKRHADYLVDIHTALTRDVRWALYGNDGGPVGEKAAGVARAFGYKSTLAAPMDILGGSALVTATKDGIPSFIIECGGINTAFDHEGVADAAERLRNVLRHLGMLEGEVLDYGPQYDFPNFAWVCAPRGGLFAATVRCGDRLDVGMPLGLVRDVFGDPIEELTSPHAGIVLAINDGPVMTNGDVLVHIGLSPKEI